MPRQVESLLLHAPRAMRLRRELANKWHGLIEQISKIPQPITF